MAFEIQYSDEALEDLLALRAFDRARIVKQVRKSLRHEATVVTLHRKPLVPAIELAAFVATWELQIGAFRVLYDIETETQVLVIRVIHKGTATLAHALKSNTEEEEK